VAKITEAIFAGTNPDGIKDTGAGLTDHYIGPILGWGFGSLAVLLLIVIVVFAMIYRRERTLDALKLPLLIVAIRSARRALDHLQRRVPRLALGGAPCAERARSRRASTVQHARSVGTCTLGV
jgi:hypothetical protein